MSADQLVDCTTCTLRGDGCADCVVATLLGGPPSEADVWRAEEARALDVLARSGLVPALRTTPAALRLAGTRAVNE
jgi:hypothetical protein